MSTNITVARCRFQWFALGLRNHRCGLLQHHGGKHECVDCGQRIYGFPY